MDKNETFAVDLRDVLRCLTAAELAADLDVSERQVYRWLHTGRAGRRSTYRVRDAARFARRLIDVQTDSVR